MVEPLLAFKGVRAGYGEAVVLDDVSFGIAERGSLAVLGRNGVGKSTMLLTLMGFTQLRRGSIVWRGADITRMPWTVPPCIWPSTIIGLRMRPRSSTTV